MIDVTIGFCLFKGFVCMFRGDVCLHEFDFIINRYVFNVLNDGPICSFAHFPFGVHVYTCC